MLNSEKDLIVFHHIPKTGGTSLINAFRGIIDRKDVIHYVPESDSFVYRNLATDVKYRTPPKLKKAAQFIFSRVGTPEKIGHPLDTDEPVPANVKMIEGHFFAGQLGGLDFGRDVLRLAIVRNPLERAVSQYDHHVRSRGVAVFTSTENFYPKDVGIEEYLLDSQMSNLQTKMLKDREGYILGCTERLAEFTTLVGLHHVGHYNQGYNRTDLEQVSPSLVREFQEANQEDYELYESVLSQEITA